MGRFLSFFIKFLAISGRWAMGSTFIRCNDYFQIAYLCKTMTDKTKNIIQWIAAALVSAVFIMSGIMKLNLPAEMVAQMAKQGITPAIAKNLAIIELVSAILFLLPRTSVLGTLLLTAYMGGAIATHVTTAQPLLVPCVIMAIIWIVSVWRNPELKTRLLG
jgi:uncharacterized membrane protein YphA (DoxX/SURF4 family)